MSACKSCGAEIVWATSEKGRTMPLDALPQRLFVLEHTGTPVPIARSTVVYTSHFVTCPDRDKWRHDD